ncbi:ATP synthase F1 subcomplex delta subunit [Orenia metallireducens]|jgi:F-type H+-transporting ATPase subunit delta|uniref:ATP synthase subunit delta n=1 Tax=Orenia metallireducens TaxID=1413210 RepID=A0A285GP98_9FIRM|nr:ATP synthase F1 subunit delta [Orenia metallireducens]PRX35760.1 ATP synthase F1 subcomplex delta subunit [Orenia metallireducens]SNY24161.1 ATP synthase F1 subcomplex delta subunit [Orenia metallireducens]
MLRNQIAERYAQALFDLAMEEKALEETQTQFHGIVGAIDSNDELKQLLSHPKLSNGQKKETLTKVFEKNLSNYLMNFIKILVDKGRVDYLQAIYQQFKKLVDIQEGRLEVQVISPIELSAKYQDKLKLKLEDTTKKEVALKLKVQPELLGGLVLKIGDKIIDGSLLNHLKKLENKLKGLEVSKLGVKIDES